MSSEAPAEMLSLLPLVADRMVKETVDGQSTTNCTVVPLQGSSETI